MSFISTTPGILSRRLASWNTTRVYSFQSVHKLCCRDGFANSSFSTASHIEIENPTVEMMKGVETERMNLFTAINDALSIALETDPTSILFGQGESAVTSFRLLVLGKRLLINITPYAFFL